MKKVLISIFTLIFIISMVTIVNAATGSINVTSSVEQVKRGETFVVTVSGTSDENISGLESKLTYDTNKLSLESKSAGENFADLSGTNEINVGSSGENQSKSGTLCTLTFKVLDKAELGETVISITEGKLGVVNSSQTQEEVSIEDKNLTVTIISGTSTEDTGDTGDGDTTGGKTVTPSTKKDTTNSGTKSGSGSKSASDEEDDKELPQTGVEVVSLVAIAGLSVCGVVSYISYKKYKNI